MHNIHSNPRSLKIVISPNDSSLKMFKKKPLPFCHLGICMLDILKIWKAFFRYECRPFQWFTEGRRRKDFKTHSSRGFLCCALQGGWLVYFNEQVLIYCSKLLRCPVITSLCASENAIIPCCGKELAVSILGSN